MPETFGVLTIALIIFLIVLALLWLLLPFAVFKMRDQTARANVLLIEQNNTLRAILDQLKRQP